MSFLSPIGFCERIKAIYWDGKKRFKVYLSSGFLPLCPSLFFPLPFVALVTSLTRGYNNHTCQPWFSRECPLSLSLITYFATAAHSNQALFQLVWPGQSNKSSPSLKVCPYWRKPSWVIHPRLAQSFPSCTFAHPIELQEHWCRPGTGGQLQFLTPWPFVAGS